MAKKLSLFILLFVYQGYINSSDRKQQDLSRRHSFTDASRGSVNSIVVSGYVKLAAGDTTSGAGASAPVLSATGKDLELALATDRMKSSEGYFTKHRARQAFTWGLRLGIAAGVAVACKTVIDLDRDANAARQDLAPLAQLAPYASQIGAIITNVCQKIPELCK